MLHSPPPRARSPGPAFFGRAAAGVIALGGGLLLWRMPAADPRQPAPAASSFAPTMADAHPHAAADTHASDTPPTGPSACFEHQLAHVFSIPEDGQLAALDTLFGRWALADLPAAAGAARALTDERLRHVAWHAVLRFCASAAPDALADYALHLPADPLRHAALEASLTAWLAEDFTAALAWADELPAVDENDPALALVATHPALVAEDAALALARAGRIREPALRSRVIADVVRHWIDHDPAAAAAFTHESPLLNPSAREDLLLLARFALAPAR